MARSRVRSFVRQGPRRAMDWDLGVHSTAFTNIAGNSKVLLASFAAAQLDPVAPATVVRTRMMFVVSSDQEAADENQLGVMGFSFQNDVARALGVTGLAGPGTDFNYDWFVYQPIAQQVRFLSAIGVEPHWSTQYVIDSKAQRKFTGGDALVIVVENLGTAGFDVAIEGRILIKAG